MLRRTFAVCLLIAAGCGSIPANSIVDTPETQDVPAPPCDELPYFDISALTTIFMEGRDAGVSEAQTRSNNASACLTYPNGDSSFATIERCLLCFDQLVHDVYH